MLSIFCPAFLAGQNLVVNGGFEEVDQCPNRWGQFEGYAVGWSTVFGSPDLFNCNYLGLIPEENPGAHSGSGHAGAVWLVYDGVKIPREYLFGTLSRHLKSGEEYYLSCWIYEPEWSIGLKNIHASIQNEGTFEILNDSIISAPITFETSDAIPRGQWVKKSTCFTASGGEKQLIFGNFYLDENSQADNGSIGTNHYAYIDDIQLYATESLLPNDTTLSLNQSYPFETFLDQIYLFNEVAIDSDYVFTEAGLYPIDVYLEECYIGTFTIDVEGCEEWITNLSLPVFRDTTYCVGNGVAVRLPATSEIKYQLNGNPVVNQIILNTAKVDTLKVEHVECGLLSTALYTGEDCSFNPVSEDCFFVPNAFSPNLDGVNDVFRAFGTCDILEYSLDIYDRWGGYRFGSTDPEEGWRGTAHGKEVDTGPYLYIMRIFYRDVEGRRSLQEAAGTVMLLR